MIRGLLSLYSPNYPNVLIYMLQRVEYRVKPYLKWYWRTSNYQTLIKRGQLDRTKKARGLLALLRTGILAEILIAAWLIYEGIHNSEAGIWGLGITVFVAYPLVWALLITLPLLLARWLLVIPKEQKLIANTDQIFAAHKAVKIAVAGSYGKTTMKELLAVVLAEGKKVAVTPANKNVASSHAIFASHLDGSEEVLVIEYGEGKPGDVAYFTRTTHPNIGVITGLAPAHLDHYPSVQAAGEDIFSLATYLNDQNIYVNGESVALRPFIKPGFAVYDSKEVGEWKIRDIKIDYNGTSFTLVGKDKQLKLKSELLGRHQVGPLAVVAVIGLSLGLSAKKVQDGIAKTVAFEHRMQPRQIGGAWVIDDTYNGNIDGIRAGLNLMAELPANQKIYITPGLVDQGEENIRVHQEMGRLIAGAKPDKVILMRNSVTDLIEAGLKEAKFQGELRIEDDPLNFYSNLDRFVAAGDLVVMQNDWPDNYY